MSAKFATVATALLSPATLLTGAPIFIGFDRLMNCCSAYADAAEVSSLTVTKAPSLPHGPAAVISAIATLLPVSPLPPAAVR